MASAGVTDLVLFGGVTLVSEMVCRLSAHGQHHPLLTSALALSPKPPKASLGFGPKPIEDLPSLSAALERVIASLQIALHLLFIVWHNSGTFSINNIFC